MSHVPMESTHMSAFDVSLDADMHASVSSVTVKKGRTFLAGAGAAMVFATAACSAEPVPTLDATTLSPAPCASDGMPKSPKELLCGDRLTGKLAIVVVEGLEKDLRAPGILTNAELDEAAKQITARVKVATGDVINLQPEVIIAPEAVANEIKNTNKGYLLGDGCVDPFDSENTLSKAVDRIMPDLKDRSTQILAFGGDACEDGTSGFIGGQSHLRIAEPTEKFADVYTDALGAGLLNARGDTPVTRFVRAAAHEVGHNYGLGHASTVTLDKAFLEQIQDPTKPVYIDDVLGNITGMNEAGDYGNLMSHFGFPLSENAEADREQLINPIQKDYLAKNTAANPDDPIVDYEFIGGSEMFISKSDPPRLEGVELSLGYSAPLGNYSFSSVVVVPHNQRDASRQSNVEIFLKTLYDKELLATARVGVFPLPDTGERVFYVGQLQVGVTLQNDGTKLTINKPG